MQSVIAVVHTTNSWWRTNSDLVAKIQFRRITMEETAPREEAVTFIKMVGKNIINRTVANNDKKSAKTGEKIACASTTIHKDVISMCVVPVKVKYGNSNIAYSTFAMLDNCSQGSLVKASLVNSVRMGGKRTSIYIKTFTGEASH